MFKEVFIAFGAAVTEGLLLMCFFLILIRQPQLLESPQSLQLLRGNLRLYFVLGFITCWLILRTLVHFYPAAMVIINWSPLGFLAVIGLTKYTMQQIERMGSEYSARAKSAIANIAELPTISPEVDEKLLQARISIMRSESELMETAREAKKTNRVSVKEALIFVSVFGSVELFFAFNHGKTIGAIHPFVICCMVAGFIFFQADSGNKKQSGFEHQESSDDENSELHK